MLSKIKKYTQLLKQKRFDFILQAIAWSVPRWLFFYGHGVYVFSENPTWTAQPLNDCDVRLAGENDIGKLVKIGMNRSAIAARFAHGDKAAIAVKNGEIMSVVWAGKGKRYLFYGGNEFDPGSGAAFYYGAYTKARGRAHGYYSAARVFLHQAMVADGAWKCWSLISANNPPWLAAVLKHNYQRKGETFFIKLLFLKILYFRKWFEPHKKLKIFISLPKDLIHV